MPILASRVRVPKLALELTRDDYLTHHRSGGGYAGPRFADGFNLTDGCSALASRGQPQGGGLGEKATPEVERLRDRLLCSLREQGFAMRDGRLVPPDQCDKERVRALHANAVRYQVERAREGLARHEDRLLAYIANGNEVVPERIRPRLVVVDPGSQEELLFRYARLHWSIPVSAGYGRRLRFVVYDEANGKLMGVLGLGDPVFSLGARDRWIGWDKAARSDRLQHVMDLFVLGAVPPYSHLLCGKLLALLATSREVLEAFRYKYDGRKTLISGRQHSGELALLTTTSALGRSSLYNRLSFKGRLVFHSLGYTQGSGEFHFSNGIYRDLRALAAAHCEATAKDARWGTGFRNRRELLRKALPLLGLSPDLVYHGVQREIFAAPLASNSLEFLRGGYDKLQYYDYNIEELFNWFRERWLLPRSWRDKNYLSFNRNSYRLWSRE